MTGFRSLSLLSAALLIWMSGDLAAQGRGNGQGKVKNQKGGGPAFCRSGAGHPVHGWEWCRQKGWDRGGVQPGLVTQGRTLPGTAVPRGRQAENYPYGTSVNDPAFDNGYADGYEKGLDDGQNRRDRNPTRHAWYRAADRNYDSRYGSRAAYANVYREGFRAGYEQGFNDGERYGDPGGFRWPF